VLLARALYREPSLLLLDEATSHLDVDREKAVNAAIRAARVTRVIIAHRPETISTADRVIVLDKGSLQREQNAAARRLCLIENADTQLLERPTGQGDG
jgi:ATP-binding cassette subfamily B protein RaxB